MFLTRTISLNGVTTTLTINTQLDKKNGFDWTISIADKNNNSASTTGYSTVTIHSANSSKTQTPVIPTNTVKSVEPVELVESVKTVEQVDSFASFRPPSPPPTNDTEKVKHCDYIKTKLNLVESTPKKADKVPIIIELFSYIKDNALNFVNSYPKFKETVINKCWEFKTYEFDQENLVKASDDLLYALRSWWPTPDRFREDLNRVELLREICENKNIPCNRDTFAKYVEWSLIYKPTGKTNRYKKMVEFVNTINNSNKIKPVSTGA